MPLRFVGQVLGRSSWARLGLIVAAAVTVHPGFAGCLTLELVNMGTVPIALYPGLRVAQLAIWQLRSPIPKDEAGATLFHGPLGPEPSHLGREKDEIEKLRRIGQSLKGLGGSEIGE
jgi:deoxycytidine triphosphate deaminase